MDTSIIIVNYNTTQLLINCIETIYKHTSDVIFEIIVVDNSSPDRSIENLTEQFPEVKLILHAENIGFGGANNLGAEMAKGDFLFFLNPDTLLLNNTVKYFTEFHKSKEKELRIGALGSVLLDNEQQINGSYSEEYSSFFKEITDSVKLNFKQNKRKEKFLNEDFKKVAWVSGADLFMRKDVFFEVNKFDENIFMYYEEVDLQKRLNKKGLYNYIIKNPRIIHLEGGSFSGKMTINKKKIIDKSRLYFYKKYSKNSFLFVVNRELFKALSWIKINKDYGKKEASEYIKFLNSL